MFLGTLQCNVLATGQLRYTDQYVESETRREGKWGLGIQYIPIKLVGNGRDTRDDVSKKNEL